MFVLLNVLYFLVKLFERLPRINFSLSLVHVLLKLILIDKGRLVAALCVAEKGFIGFNGLIGFSAFNGFNGFDGLNGFSAFNWFSAFNRFNAFNGLNGFCWLFTLHYYNYKFLPEKSNNGRLLSPLICWRTKWLVSGAYE